ncbi:hypothetical protein [Halomicrobium urmianum]|uniref:hypothetical protein n=1 Tax=Halomicrobium urmianum TaxID=1586233 RepID=UPI001CD9627F|nr:hypothetical protein [Halomicrobium urmianum]
MSPSDSIRRHLPTLSEAVSYPFETWRGTIGLVLATYVLLLLSATPEFPLPTLGDGLSWLEYVVVSLTEPVYRTDGWTGLGIGVLYALLSGAAVVNAVAQLRVADRSSRTNLSGVGPGLLASGRASCGAGLLGFFPERAGYPERRALTTEATR